MTTKNENAPGKPEGVITSPPATCSAAAICEGCKEPFETWDRIYRCVDCETQYHRHCLMKHFAVSKAEWVANALAALYSGKITLALAILERHTEEEKCQPPNGKLTDAATKNQEP